MRRSFVSLAVAFTFVLSGAPAVFTQGGGGQTPPRQWWVNKDKPGQYGKNKVHIKLADLKARHKGQPILQNRTQPGEQLRARLALKSGKVEVRPEQSFLNQVGVPGLRQEILPKPPAGDLQKRLPARFQNPAQCV